MQKKKAPIKSNKSKFSPNKTKIIIAIVAVISLIAFIALYHKPDNFQNINNDANGSVDHVPTMESIGRGKVLASHYCSSCHMLPDPSLLNRTKWNNNVLPQMGLRLGIREHQGYDYTVSVKAPDLYVPEKPVLNGADWQDIIDYYVNTAPINLPSQNRTVQIERKMPFFSLITPPTSFLSGKLLGCMVRIDTTVKPVRIFVANGVTKELFLLTNKLKIIDSVKTDGPVVDILFDHVKTMICTIGKELGGTSDKFGAINVLEISKTGKMKIDSVPLFTDLARPVQILSADLNNDGLKDYLICEFGNINGELCWMENKGAKGFTKHVIRPMPGAIKAYIDYSRNKNAPDLWVLFAQGEEGIYHFLNDGKGSFVQQRVLRFPPIYGSSFFEMVDINGDGFKDIIYTCGDNGDLSAVKKPYHGVYIFLNDTHGKFVQKYFYPIDGCYKAYARDFSGNGRIDIATVSFFTDPRQPEEGFVYLRNTGGLNFEPYSLPAGTKFERGITMDEGDLNGDGKPDLLIGNAFFDTGPFGYNQKETLFFILKNKTR